MVVREDQDHMAVQEQVEEPQQLVLTLEQKFLLFLEVLEVMEEQELEH